ncbi:MAG: hypothetical protein U1E76_08935 [Planctomycetota bacterium]
MTRVLVALGAVLLLIAIVVLAWRRPDTAPSRSPQLERLLEGAARARLSSTGVARRASRHELFAESFAADLDGRWVLVTDLTEFLASA